MGDYNRSDAKMVAELVLDVADRGYDWKQRALALDAENTRLRAAMRTPFASTLSHDDALERLREINRLTYES